MRCRCRAEKCRRGADIVFRRGVEVVLNGADTTDAAKIQFVKPDDMPVKTIMTTENMCGPVTNTVSSSTP